MYKRFALRKIITFFMAIIAYLITTTVFPLIPFDFIYPNLFILLTCIMSFMGGKREGAYAGFICGFFVDIMMGSILGYNTMLFMLMGFFNGLFTKMYFSEDVLFPIALVSISDFVYNMLVYIFYFLLKNRLNFGYYFMHIILPEIIFTVVITVITYRLFLKLHTKLERYEKGSVSELD